MWNFIQQQILGMKWLNEGLASILEFINIDLDSKLGSSLHFFIYDVIKISILLVILIFIVSYIQSYFPPERTKRILSHYSGLGARILSALLGTLTPFCSCSSIPLFIGFTNANLPIGVTFAFLISSPLVDLGSLVLLMSIFGTRIALIYVIVGLILAVVCGSIIEYLNLDKYVIKYECNSLAIEELNNKDRIIYAKQQVIFTYKKVYKYILIGVGIGALIHNVIPTEFIMNTLGSNNPFNVILATIIGIPMYGDIFGTIPIAEALLIKGVGLGTILSFMMAVTALSLPSIIMLKEVIKPKLLGIFITIVTLGIIIVGYLFNIIA